MKKELEALRRKDITFDEFARRTSRDWDRLALHVWRKWRSKVPRGVALEDVRQEMLVWAWRAVGKYDPGKGPTLQTYVVWMACSKAKRFLHEQRNALRRDDNAESRYAAAFSELGRSGATEEQSLQEWFEGQAARHMAEDLDLVDLEDLVDLHGSYELALHESDGIDAFALMALKLAKGDVRQASEMMFDEPNLRRWGRWNSPDSAAHQIALTVGALFG